MLGMAHTDYESALKGRLQDIERELRPFEKLIQERNYIMRLLALRGDTPDTHYDRAVQRGVQVVDAPHARAFPVNPGSKTSLILTEARRILESYPKREASFLELYRKLPKQVLSTSRHAREHARGALMRAGDRVGIRYVDSDHVRLVS